MTGMTGGATAFASIRVDSTYTSVWPGRWVQLTIGEYLYIGSMALAAAIGYRSGSTYNGAEVIVERIQNVSRFCMVGSLLLLKLILVAAGTVLGTHYGSYPETTVIGAVRVPWLLINLLFGSVTIVTVYSLLPHPSKFPHLVKARGFQLVAFYADLAFRSSIKFWINLHSPVTQVA